MKFYFFQSNVKNPIADFWDRYVHHEYLVIRHFLQLLPRDLLETPAVEEEEELEARDAQHEGLGVGRHGRRSSARQQAL